MLDQIFMNYFVCIHYHLIKIELELLSAIFFAHPYSSLHISFFLNRRCNVLVALHCPRPIDEEQSVPSHRGVGEGGGVRGSSFTCIDSNRENDFDRKV